MVASFTGKCHCGEVGFEYRTELVPTQWTVRSCQCAFCRAHGVRATTDPAGSVRFAVKNPDSLSRYEFGLRTAQFLICSRCGVYIAALMSTPHGRFATINVNTLDPAPEGLSRAQAVTYDQEAAIQRISRRVERWTPVTGDV